MNNVVVQNGATSDFKARQNVQINTEFHAESGSETHLFIEETFPVCTDFSAYRTSTIPPAEQTENDISFTQDIEIQFKKNITGTGFIFYPNPNDGKYTLAITETESHTINAIVEIYTLVGNKVYSQSITTQFTNMDVSQLTKGIYMIKLKHNNKIESKKLVIQ